MIMLKRLFFCTKLQILYNLHLIAMALSRRRAGGGGPGGD